MADDAVEAEEPGARIGRSRRAAPGRRVRRRLRHDAWAAPRPGPGRRDDDPELPPGVPCRCQTSPAFRRLWDEGYKDRMPRAEAWIKKAAP